MSIKKTHANASFSVTACFYGDHLFQKTNNKERVVDAMKGNEVTNKNLKWSWTESLKRNSVGSS